jgi:hypothetical protein
MSKKQAGPQLTLAQIAAKKAEKEENRKTALKKLATKRVNKAIKMYSGIGNLANYKPTQEQIDVIERALANAHNLAIKRLKGTAESASDFTL